MVSNFSNIPASADVAYGLPEGAMLELAYVARGFKAQGIVGPEGNAASGVLGRDPQVLQAIQAGHDAVDDLEALKLSIPVSFHPGIDKAISALSKAIAAGDPAAIKTAMAIAATATATANTNANGQDGLESPKTKFEQAWAMYEQAKQKVDAAFKELEPWMTEEEIQKLKDNDKAIKEAKAALDAATTIEERIAAQKKLNNMLREDHQDHKEIIQVAEDRGAPQEILKKADDALERQEAASLKLQKASFSPAPLQQAAVKTVSAQDQSSFTLNDSEMPASSSKSTQPNFEIIDVALTDSAQLPVPQVEKLQTVAASLGLSV